MKASKTEFFQMPGLFATSALTMLVDDFGSEVVSWEPETLALNMKDRYGQEPNQGLSDRINAISSLYTTDMFLVDLQTFLAICNSLNFGVVSSETLIPADVDDVLWGVTEAYMNIPDEIKEHGFSHDIRRYVGMLLADAGITKAPSVVEWAEFPEEETDRLADAMGEDPLMNAYWDKQVGEQAELEAFTSQKSRDLINQLQALPIENKSADFKTASV